MSKQTGSGQFVWYDRMTSDPKAARDFYGGLIDWGTRSWDDGGQTHTLWTNRDTPFGGVVELDRRGPGRRRPRALAGLCCGPRHQNDHRSSG